MKKNEDEIRIKNWQAGDTFAYKINSDKYKNYNERFILFTVIDIPVTWNLRRTSKGMISKITTNDVLPKNQNDYDNLETIKLGNEDPVELANRLYEIKYTATPDKFGYIYNYILEMWLPKYKTNDDMKYIGNFNFTQPTDSFFDTSSITGVRLVRFDEEFLSEIDFIIDLYEMHNLKQGYWYTEEYLQDREKIRQDNKDFMNYLKEMLENIRCQEENISNTSFEKDKKHRDTLTYVGQDESKKTKKGKNISKLSFYYNKIDKDKVSKIFEILNIDNMVVYVDGENDNNFIETLNKLQIGYVENFNATFNQIFLKLDKETYLKLYDYMQEKDILISSTMIKDNWQFYLNIFTKEVCLGMLSYDTNCILEIDDYEKVISVQFRKEEYNSKELIKNIKSILR